MNEMTLFQNRPRRGIAETMVEGLGSGLPAHVSIKGNKFALVDNGGMRYPWPDAHLDVVIIDANSKSRIYWGRDFTGEDEGPPACFSDNGVAPSRNAQQPQARTCAECPMSGWGSATSKITGKGVPACRQLSKLALLVVSGDGWGRVEEPVYLLSTPPNSLKNLVAYSNQLKKNVRPGTSEKLDVCDVVTRVTFTDNELGTLSFHAVGWINQGIANAIDETTEEETGQIVGRNDVPWTGAQLPAPQAASQMTQKQAQIDPPGNVAQFPATPAAEKPSGRGGARPGAGRPKKGDTVTPAPEQALERLADTSDDMPAFLRRGPDNQPNFGMAQPKPADQGIQDAIDAAFKLPV